MINKIACHLEVNPNNLERQTKLRTSAEILQEYEMPRDRKIYAQAINVRLHDHANANYDALLRDIYRRKIRVNYRSSDYLMISSLRPDAESKHVLHGTLAKFVEINKKGDWLDMDTGEKADDDMVEQIVIPDHLFPNLTSFYFRFDAKLHLFTFEAIGRNGSLSAGSVRKFFEEALSEQFVLEKFGHSEVTVVADHQEVENLFEFDRLSKIKIVIERPNDVGLDDMEKKVLEELDKENARRLERETVAAPGNSLTPSEDTILLAKVAARNGSVETRGEEGNVMKDKSTVDIPLREGHEYDPEVEAESTAFENAARALEKRYRQI